jgi:hypothetical protein
VFLATALPEVAREAFHSRAKLPIGQLTHLFFYIAAIDEFTPVDEDCIWVVFFLATHMRQWEQNDGKR